jgi:hypothetical protein
MIKEGVFEFAASGQDVFSIFNKVAKIETWLSEISSNVMYETETRAIEMFERNEISFIMCPPVVEKRHVMEIANSGLVFIPKATRHIFPARPFGVNVPLDLLRDKNVSVRDANHRLLEMLNGRTLKRVSPENQDGHRKYDEAIYIFE